MSININNQKQDLKKIISTLDNLKDTIETVVSNKDDDDMISILEDTKIKLKKYNLQLLQIPSC